MHQDIIFHQSINNPLGIHREHGIHVPERISRTTTFSKPTVKSTLLKSINLSATGTSWRWSITPTTISTQYSHMVSLFSLCVKIITLFIWSLGFYIQCIWMWTTNINGSTWPRCCTRTTNIFLFNITLTAQIYSCISVQVYCTWTPR